jgi:hypothetical protein
MITPELLRLLFQYNAWAESPPAGCLRLADERTIHARSGLEFQFRARHARASLRRRLGVE